MIKASLPWRDWLQMRIQQEAQFAACCTKAELWDLYCRALLAKSELPAGSPGRANAIRMLLNRPRYTRTDGVAS